MKKLLSYILVAMVFILNVLPAQAASVISLQAELDKSTAVPGSAITISGKVFKEGAPTKAVSPTLTVTDPQGNYIYSYQWNAPQDIGDDGSFTTVYNLVEKAITGTYSVVLRAGDSLTTLSFTVVPSGQISVTTDKNLYYENQTVTISGQVNNNFTPVGNTDVTVKITDGNQVVKSIDQVKTAANGTYQSNYVLPSTIAIGVYTIEVAGIGVKNTTTFNVSPEPPSGVTNFIGSATTSSIILTWDASERAAAYVLKRDGVKVYEGSALTFTDNGLTPDTNYSYELVANNAGGETTPFTITVKTIKVAPTAPTNLVYSATQTGISLIWDAAERAESYELRRNGEVIYTGAATSFADSGLTPGTTYSYELKAVNSGGASTTITLSATTLPQPPNAITNFTGSATTSSIILTWDASERAAAYVLKRDGVKVYEGSALTFTDNGLTPDTNYSYELVANNAGGATTPSTITVKTIKVAPTAPTNLASTTVTTTSISLTWDAAERAESYELRRNGEVVYTGAATSFADSGLTPGTTYSYELKAVNSGGASTTVTLSATTLPQPPNAITNFTGTATTTSVTLTWDASDRAAGYIVKRDGVNVYEGTALTFTDNGLTPDTNYSYELVASNAGGATTPSTITVKTIKVAPTAPTNLASTTVTTTSISLTWDAAERAESYELRRNGEVVYTGAATSFADSGLTPGTTYSYELKAVNSGGTSTTVTLSATTLPQPPNAITNFTGTATTTSVTLTWDASDRAAGYIVKRDGVNVYEGSALTFTDNGLTPDTNYSYELVASNAGGATTPSTITVKTIKVAPTAPTNLASTTVTTTSISLTWDAAERAESYELRRNGEVVYTGAATSFADSGLTPGTTYSYELKAVNSGGTSSTVTLSATTVKLAPVAPTGFTYTASTTSINLTWVAAAGAESYELKRNGQVVFSGTATSFVDTGLTSGTNYSYELKAVNSGGASQLTTLTAITQQVVITPPPPVIVVPGSVTGLKGEATTNSVSLTWNAVSGAEKYELKRNGTVVYTGANTSFTDISLTAGTAYSYEIKAINAGGSSSAVTISVSTLQAVPGAITNFKGVATANSINLTWDALAHATSYTLKRNGQTVYEGTGLSFMDSDLVSNTAYSYELEAKNTGGATTPATITVSTLKGLPKAPTNVQFEAEATSISFTWDEVDGAEEYVLIRSGEEVYRGTETSFNDTSLLPGRKYNYRLLAVNTVGESSPVRVTVGTLSVKPSSVTGLEAKSTENQVTLTWDAAEFATSYVVKLNGKVLYSGTKTAYTHRNLKSNTTYTYSVTAINKAGVSKANSISIKTKAIQTKTSVSVSKSTYKQSESFVFTTKVTDKNNKVIPSAYVTLVVKDPNGKTTTYNGKTNKVGLFVLTIKTNKSTKVGAYKISVSTKFNVKDAYSNSYAAGSYTVKK